MDIFPKNFEPRPKLQTNFKYALVGLAPYTLHYDLSRCKREAYYLPKYFFALKDLHNYWLDFETVKSFLNPAYVEHLENKSFTKNNYRAEHGNGQIDLHSAIEALNEIETWSKKSYPETVAENKQTIENYLSLLEKYNVRAILHLPPMVKEYQDNFCREKLDELFAFLNELYQRHSFVFVNGWAMEGFNDHDFYDINHMNVSGAKKFSSRLNDVIMKLEG